MIPKKIQMIKEVREVTGLSLGDAKAIVDWMTRRGGSIESMIDEVQANPNEIYKGVPMRSIPSLSAMPSHLVETVWQSEDSGDLEERVTRIENWIRAEMEK